MISKHNWNLIFQDYFSHELTYSQIQGKYGVSLATLSRGIKFESDRRKGVVHKRKPKKLYRSPIGPKFKLRGKKFILSRIDVNECTGCWDWNMALNDGYGQFAIDGVRWSAHRYSYTHFNGEIPDGLIVRHMCHNRSCCNPRHLKLGTVVDNWHDSSEVYHEMYKRLGYSVKVNGVEYSSYRKAAKDLGMHMGTISKYTVDGVFDVESYVGLCEKRGFKHNFK